VYCRSAEPLPLQTVGSSGKKERIMRYVLALLAAVNAWAVMPASSEECEPGLSLASLDNTYTAELTSVASAQLRLEPDQKTALVKEGEFDSPETIAAIEENREDRERTVVMDR
jgi:ABC-type sugar transport system substrate-binding protein